MRKTGRKKALFLSGALALGLVLAGLLLGRRPHGAADSLGVSVGAFEGSNLLLVTIDTLRADALGCYGGRDARTPVIDRLAREGVRFESAFAHATTTLPSHASILTGRYPFAHGVHDNGSFRLDPRETTLAEVLKEKGYRTGAFVGAFVLDARFGLNQGFDRYDDFYGERPSFSDFNFTERRAVDVLTAARNWLVESSPQPFFVWVHLFDPHVPYEPPSPYRERHAAAPYFGEVEATDQALGDFLSELAKAGRLENTLVALTSDHGESLGEHGETTHGTFAYNATLRVPMILWSSRALSPRVFSRPVGHVDLTATLVALLGLPPSANLQGRNLCAGLEGEDPPLYFEALSPYLTQNLAPLTGVVSGTHKFIELPVPELYDLAADPGEKTNLFERNEREASRLRAQLKTTSGPVPGSAPAPADAALDQRLLSLGYLGARRSPPKKTYTDEDDPKTQIALIEEHRGAMESYAAGATNDAVARLEKVIARRPDWTQAYLDLAAVFLATGRPDDGVTLLRKAARLEPESAFIQARLGSALSDAGALDEALVILERAAKESPADADAAKALGVTYARRGSFSEAQRELERALTLAPSSGTTYSNLGSLFLQQKKLGEARAAFERALALSPNLALAHEGLGAVHVETGNLEAAAKAWAEAVRLSPDHFDTVFNLGMLLLQLNRPLDALPYLERFAADAPSEYAADRRKVSALVSEIRSRARM